MSETKHEERYGAYMTANNAPAPLVASASQSNWGAFRAFSESLEDDITFTGLATGTEQWVQIQLDAPIRIWAVRISCRTTVSAKDSGQVPKNFTVQGSEDGTTFEDIQTYTDAAWDQFTTWDAANNQYNWADAKKIEINSQKEYQYYRFVFGECQAISTQKAGSMTPTSSNTVKLTLIDLYQVEVQMDPPKAIEIVDSTCVEVSAGTSLTASVTASPGDIILATITVRSALSIPEGWNLLFTSEYVIDTGNQQSISFAIKTAESSMESITVTQAESKRIYVNLISIRGSKGVVPYQELTTYVNTAPSTKGYKIQVPDKKQGEKIIWGCSATSWATSSPYGDWETTPDDLQGISLGQSKTAPRQANFIDLGQGVVNRTFTATPKSTGSVCVIAAVRLLEYDTRYLIKSKDVYYSIVDGALVKTDVAELTAQSFKDYGISDVPGEEVLRTLESPQLFYWQDSQDPLPEKTAIVQAIPKTQTVYTTEQDLSEPSIVGITSVAVDASEGILMAFSSDRGSFRIMEAGVWVDAAEEAGMSKTEVEAVTEEQWAMLMGNDVYQIRFLIPEGAYMKKTTVTYKNEGGIT